MFLCFSGQFPEDRKRDYLVGRNGAIGEGVGGMPDRAHSFVQDEEDQPIERKMLPQVFERIAQRFLDLQAAADPDGNLPRISSRLSMPSPPFEAEHAVIIARFAICRNRCYGMP